jgi:hypothetical protein
MQDLLRQGDFHAALLHCALEVVAYVAHEVGPRTMSPWEGPLSPGCLLCV